MRVDEKQFEKMVNVDSYLFIYGKISFYCNNGPNDNVLGVRLRFLGVPSTQNKKTSFRGRYGRTGSETRAQVRTERELMERRETNARRPPDASRRDLSANR